MLAIKMLDKRVAAGGLCSACASRSFRIFKGRSRRHDGFRILAMKRGSDVRLWSRNGRLSAKSTAEASGVEQHAAESKRR
jgi:hypothetical protein